MFECRRKKKKLWQTRRPLLFQQETFTPCCCRFGRNVFVYEIPGCTRVMVVWEIYRYCRMSACNRTHDIAPLSRWLPPIRLSLRVLRHVTVTRDDKTRGGGGIAREVTNKSMFSVNKRVRSITAVIAIGARSTQYGRNTTIQCCFDINRI